MRINDILVVVAQTERGKVVIDNVQNDSQCTHMNYTIIGWVDDDIVFNCVRAFQAVRICVIFFVENRKYTSNSRFWAQLTVKYA